MVLIPHAVAVALVILTAGNVPFPYPCLTAVLSLKGDLIETYRPSNNTVPCFVVQ